MLLYQYLLFRMEVLNADMELAGSIGRVPAYATTNLISLIATELRNGSENSCHDLIDASNKRYH
jgi:hypothetical protein